MKQQHSPVDLEEAVYAFSMADSHHCQHLRVGRATAGGVQPLYSWLCAEGLLLVEVQGTTFNARN